MLDPVALQRLESRRRLRRAQVRRRRIVLASVLAALSFAGYAAFGGGGGAARVAVSRQPLPGPRLTALVAAREVVPGHRPHLPWPATGQGAVAVLGSGLVARSPREHEVPIASLTKMMTAYVILQDHPLELGASGPSIRMTRADVATWVADSQSGDSTVPVKAGEVLSEYQLLEGLLVPSGDNVASKLAAWDAGSVRAFVAKMNATAVALGLGHTHYADASGVDPASRSTAADQAVLAAELMNDPVVRRIVAYHRLPFPVAGTIWNYNPALGVDGIVGVKSGFTSQAQGCLVTAAYRDVGGRSALVVAASVGQPGGLYGAATADEALLASATRGLVRFSVLPPGSRVANASFAWSDATVPVRAAALPGSIVTWPGTVLRLRLLATVTSVPATGSAEQTPLGTLEVRSSGGLYLSVPLAGEQALPAVPAGWSPSSS